MPVLITLATISLLRGREGPPLPFFDADLMADMLADRLQDADPETRDAALAVTENIRTQMSAYREQVLAGVEAYERNAASGTLDLEALSTDLEPYDRQRTDILHAVVRYRRELIGLLDEEQWATVFD